eukprot:GHVU01179424.1.p1 GENE.GHVU01179424.1~~GHVU01179424.1.p1  ORF type:complete len:140 (-),score=31.56 GHVU01179424.1:510-929(-)
MDGGAAPSAVVREDPTAPNADRDETPAETVQAPDETPDSVDEGDDDVVQMKLLGVRKQPRKSNRVGADDGATSDVGSEKGDAEAKAVLEEPGDLAPGGPSAVGPDESSDDAAPQQDEVVTIQLFGFRKKPSQASARRRN